MAFYPSTWRLDGFAKKICTVRTGGLGVRIRTSSSSFSTDAWLDRGGKKRFAGTDVYEFTQISAGRFAD